MHMGAEVLRICDLNPQQNQGHLKLQGMWRDELLRRRPVQSGSCHRDAMSRKTSDRCVYDVRGYHV